MYCPECGIKNEENSKFCAECGTKLVKNPTPEEKDITDTINNDRVKDLDYFAMQHMGLYYLRNVSGIASLIVFIVIIVIPAMARKTWEFQYEWGSLFYMLTVTLLFIFICLFLFARSTYARKLDYFKKHELGTRD